MDGKELVKEEVIRRSISLYPKDMEIVETVQRRYGLGFSGALRFIINDWARMHEAQMRMRGETARDER